MGECEHNQTIRKHDDLPGTCYCVDCQTYVPIPYPRQYMPSHWTCAHETPVPPEQIPSMHVDQSDERKAYDRGYAAGDAAGYARAKAEMLAKLDTFNPVYVEGGRVPEDAIEHRNQPRTKEMP